MGSSSIECLSFRPCRLSSSSSLSRSRGSENMSPFIVKLVSQQSARNMSIFHGHQRHLQSLHKCTTLSSSNGAHCPPRLLSNVSLQTLSIATTTASIITCGHIVNLSSHKLLNFFFRYGQSDLFSSPHCFVLTLEFHFTMIRHVRSTYMSAVCRPLIAVKLVTHTHTYIHLKTSDLTTVT